MMHFLFVFLMLRCFFSTAELLSTAPYDPTIGYEEFPTTSNDRKELILGQITAHASQVDCNVDQFQCHNSTQCILASWICDNETDCDDGSDEIGCDSCRGFEATCDNSTKCLHLSWFCDNISDCADGSDETDCESCRPNYVKCYNTSKCIPDRWICDNDNDCGDGSDEIDCYRKELILGTITTPESQGGCNVGQFQCYNSTQCIFASWICDNVTHCDDGSDEIYCDLWRAFLDQYTTPEYQTTEFTPTG